MLVSLNLNLESLSDAQPNIKLTEASQFQNTKRKLTEASQFQNTKRTYTLKTTFFFMFFIELKT